jgi:hypothetical protein
MFITIKDGVVVSLMNEPSLGVVVEIPSELHEQITLPAITTIIVDSSNRWLGLNTGLDEVLDGINTGRYDHINDEQPSEVYVCKCIEYEEVSID